MREARCLDVVMCFCPFQEMAKEAPVCTPESMSSEDMLFMLYTSGSTGTPKGLVHTQAGYLLYAAMTHKVGAQGKRAKDASCQGSGRVWVGQGELAVMVRISAATGLWCRCLLIACS